ncbi:GGDEF domain-containing protein [Henriciella aquimarina]|uniref:GGDEF domain-containing protein n=1 Tax=Henriciella aquimarina TaxID=545261 RepID=UPI00117A9789|nr:sensor domain-containing diguanylate cyclase [Henriciella aquimarina]
MLNTLLRGKSLRFWIGTGMVLAVAPLAVMLLAGYFHLSQNVIGPFHDASLRERAEVAPIQSLRVLVWDTLIPVDEFVDEGGAQRPDAYRALRTKIESGFADLRGGFENEPAILTLVDRALESWTEADRLATELISVERAPGDPEAAAMMERFHGHVASSSDRLGVAYEKVAGEIQADHDAAVSAFAKANERAVLAAILSALAIIAGVVLIGRVMAASVDRLVNGAARVADGDRDHRIDVRVPPELRRVAAQFNRMIRRIQESEAALSELARVDGLTGMKNRRAFDEALTKMHGQMSRTDETGAVLFVDIDHFKRVNDTYGHAAGDDVLRAIARLVTSSLRPFDGIYRIGGEEFCVLLPGVKMEAASDLAERLREEVAQRPITAGDSEIPVTISIGGAKAIASLEPGKIIEAADAALYRAKTTGRNRVVMVDEFGAHKDGVLALDPNSEKAESSRG